MAQLVQLRPALGTADRHRSGDMSLSARRERFGGFSSRFRCCQAMTKDGAVALLSRGDGVDSSMVEENGRVAACSLVEGWNLLVRSECFYIQLAPLSNSV